MKNINVMNFEPPVVPCCSVPGKLREEKPKVDHQQRGQPSITGSDSNKQSDANKEFSHHYYD
eukprot:14790012-Alexandrium_andersonii.AAC.1